MMDRITYSMAFRLITLFILLIYVLGGHIVNSDSYHDFKNEILPHSKRVVPRPNLKRHSNNKKYHNNRNYESPSLLQPKHITSFQMTSDPHSSVLNRLDSNPQNNPNEKIIDSDLLTERKDYRVEQILQNILSKLNLKTPPNVTGVVISSNPVVQEMIRNVSKSVPLPVNSAHQLLNYQRDEHVDVETKKMFIPVEERECFIVEI